LWEKVSFLLINVGYLTFNLVAFIADSEPEFRGSSFTFGQILSTMLLAAPLLMIVVEIISAIAGEPEVKRRFSTFGGVATALNDEDKTVHPPTETVQDEYYEGPVQESTRHFGFNTCLCTCGPQPEIRIGWAFFLLMLQAWYASITTLLWYSIHSERPTTALQSHLPWLFITLPSAIYFMVILALAAQGSKVANALGFVILAVYSATLWPVSLSKLAGDTKRSLVDDKWPSPVIYVLASSTFVGLYMVFVYAAALYRRLTGREAV
jgi:hypothetical protein